LTFEASRTLWTGYENILAARYAAGSHSKETALYFAQGEINAIITGRHWTHGKPTPADPLRLTLEALSPNERELFLKHVAILEHDAGMGRADAEAQAITVIINRMYHAPVERPRSIYRSSDAIKRVLAAGVGIKPFFAKSKDNDPAAYTADLKKAAELWSEGQRRFKAFIRGHFLVVDIDRKSGKPDGLEAFYRLFSRETLPAELQELPGSFPCYVQTPSSGFHLYFRYEGPELNLRELAPGIEIKEWQITCPGSRRENGEYVLHGELDKAPPLYGLITDAIENTKRKKEQAKAEHSRPRTKAAADRPVQYKKPRITLDDLAGEATDAHAGNHDRQVSFAGRAFRCKFSGAETLAYVKSRPDIFGNDADTENTILSVFRDNGGCL
jgi:hypothetical protein